jgi:NAD(P) transhydrogenase
MRPAPAGRIRVLDDLKEKTMEPRYDYDVLVIGSGPAGQRAAIQSAKLGRRVGIVERQAALGGVSANTGTIPSKTLRAAIVDLTGLAQRSVYGDAYRVKEEVSVDDLTSRVRHVVEHERALVADQLRRNHVELLHGHASFVDPHTLVLASLEGTRRVSAAQIVIAVGSRPARPAGVDFDDRTVIDSDGISNLDTVPQTMTVVGGGIIGLEYASMAAALGIEVTVIEKRTRLLDFVDAEIVEALQYHLRDLRVVFRLGEEVSGVERHAGGVVTHLRSGKHIPSEVVLYAAGRQAAAAGLGLEAAGLEADSRGRLAVDAEFRTAQPHIFAVGDVIGFPALAATSMEQGRLAASIAAGVDGGAISELLPYGVYTLPEISMVGRTEEELTEAAVPYVVGTARYREISRGVIAGDRYGMLKLLVDPSSRQLLGVHVIGTAATEIVHIGQTVMGTGATIDFLIEAVFNYPTFADAYKTAALDAMNRLYALNGSAEPLVRRAA